MVLNAIQSWAVVRTQSSFCAPGNLRKGGGSVSSQNLTAYARYD